jgi:hypothetical protein
MKKENLKQSAFSELPAPLASPLGNTYDTEDREARFGL